MIDKPQHMTNIPFAYVMSVTQRNYEHTNLSESFSSKILYSYQSSGDSGNTQYLVKLFLDKVDLHLEGLYIECCNCHHHIWYTISVITTYTLTFWPILLTLAIHGRMQDLGEGLTKNF